MVISRKNIISKAESAQITKENVNETKPVNQSEEDVWFNKESLYRVSLINFGLFLYKEIKFSFICDLFVINLLIYL